MNGSEITTLLIKYKTENKKVQPVFKKHLYFNRDLDFKKDDAVIVREGDIFEFM